jgi:hypothetical protein
VSVPLPPRQPYYGPAGDFRLFVKRRRAWTRVFQYRYIEHSARNQRGCFALRTQHRRLRGMVAPRTVCFGYCSWPLRPRDGNCRREGFIQLHCTHGLELLKRVAFAIWGCKTLHTGKRNTITNFATHTFTREDISNTARTVVPDWEPTVHTVIPPRNHWTVLGRTCIQEAAGLAAICEAYYCFLSQALLSVEGRPLEVSNAVDLTRAFFRGSRMSATV